MKIMIPCIIPTKVNTEFYERFIFIEDPIDFFLAKSKVRSWKHYTTSKILSWAGIFSNQLESSNVLRVVAVNNTTKIKQTRTPRC